MEDDRNESAILSEIGRTGSLAGLSEQDLAILMQAVREGKIELRIVADSTGEATETRLYPDMMDVSYIQEQIRDPEPLQTSITPLRQLLASVIDNGYPMVGGSNDNYQRP